jgi:biopolymer transport protein ExbD
MRRLIIRTSTEPRMEMAPLLDVIFLLLTFFIYSMIVSVRAQVLPVNLPTLTTGQIPADAPIAGITVDAAGKLFLNQKPIEPADLEQQLRQLTSQPKPPTVFIALDDRQSSVDRGPMFIQLIDMMRRLGIQDFNLVGQDRPANPTP